MMNSASSPWKPLICNFPSDFTNFLQMQSAEELNRASTEMNTIVGVTSVNVTELVMNDIFNSAIHIHGIVAAVVSLFPALFPSGLPAKYFMHAFMAQKSRAWGSDGGAVLVPIADLFNHYQPTDVLIAINKDGSTNQLSHSGISLLRDVERGDEVFNGAHAHRQILHFSLKFQCRLRDSPLHRSFFYHLR
jgi:hypothetical protein